MAIFRTDRSFAKTLNLWCYCCVKQPDGRLTKSKSFSQSWNSIYRKKKKKRATISQLTRVRTGSRSCYSHTGPPPEPYILCLQSRSFIIVPIIIITYPVPTYCLDARRVDCVFCYFSFATQLHTTLFPTGQRLVGTALRACRLSRKQ